jgi:hypothetical protein
VEDVEEKAEQELEGSGQRWRKRDGGLLHLKRHQTALERLKRDFRNWRFRAPSSVWIAVTASPEIDGATVERMEAAFRPNPW